VKLIETDEGVRRVALRTPAGFLAFGFGAGLSRCAPGTVGTAVAVPLAWGLKALPQPVFLAVLIAAFLLGVRLCGITSARLGRHDPGGIVWDEMVGYWLTIAFLPAHWTWFLAAFVLFRIFDILKPWPIRRLERRLGGGWGIMADDLLAGVYAMAPLLLVLHWP
jgi:phosphatidylglycerophosphatase A